MPLLRVSLAADASHRQVGKCKEWWMRSETSGEVGVPATNSVRRKYRNEVLNTIHRGEVQGCLKKNVAMGRGALWFIRSLEKSLKQHLKSPRSEPRGFTLTMWFVIHNSATNFHFSALRLFFKHAHTWNIPRAARVPPTLLPRATQPTFDRSSPFQLPAQLSKSTEWKVCRSHELLR